MAKMAAMVAIFDIRMEPILNLHAAPMPSTKFLIHLADLQFGSRQQLKTFKMITMQEKNVKTYWWTYGWGTDHGQQTIA